MCLSGDGRRPVEDEWRCWIMAEAWTVSLPCKTLRWLDLGCYRLDCGHACARAAQAVVTHNVRDLTHGEQVWPHLRILTPAQFLEELP